jgi:molybdate transport system ATP-binding protein
VVERGPTKEVLSRPRSAFTARVAGLDLVDGVGVPGGLRTADGAVLAGTGGAVAGEPAVAVFRPAAVSVHRGRPTGSPRNVVAAVVAGLEPRGDLIRVRFAAAGRGPAWVAGLAADLTPAAVAELEVAPDAAVYLAVKAAEVRIYPVNRG